VTPRTLALAALAAAALALALSSWCRADHESIAAPRTDSPAPLLGPHRLKCRRPPELRLIRFEDGSARLQCGRSLLVRISVPG
jgi:hypothetical protein